MKAIVTTTINPPTEALRKYSQMEGWKLYVVGDKKTPDLYQDFNYLSPEDQEKKYLKLSKLIPWNCIQRRNLGFIEAYNDGAEIIATVDDDNIPTKDWGKGCTVNTHQDVHIYYPKNNVFDPLTHTNKSYYWHRGYPIQLLADKNTYIDTKTAQHRRVLVQADLWTGDPDIDAIARIGVNEEFIDDFFYDGEDLTVEQSPYAGCVMGPFNSQNTFLSREIFPTYFLFPFIGRMDDIWASYVTQHYYKDCVAYCKPSVRQERNKHNLVKDLKDEMIGYENTLKLLGDLDNWERYLPKSAIIAYNQYMKEFRE
ncbi:MAG: hypothetical protein KKH61_20465 [Gammaproteobacteria bacterium]|nr:hypothetical protein [Gammaproteobacteria bacterium]